MVRYKSFMIGCDAIDKHGDLVISVTVHKMSFLKSALYFKNTDI